MTMLRDDMLVLRAVEPEDLEVMSLLENDASLWESTCTTAPYSTFVLKEYIKRCSCNFFEDHAVRLAIALPEGIAVGFIDLQNYDPQHQRAELGIVLMRECQHHGLARRAVTLMSEYARDVLHLHQVYAHVQCANLPALRLFQSVGFTHTATLPQWVRGASGWHDVAVFQLLLDR